MEVVKSKKFSVSDMLLCALFAALAAVGAFIRIPLPYVPFSLQFMFTNLAGLLLGKKRGAISVLLYIFIGLVGFPVFTQGGGIGYVLTPSFGYLIGMAVGAWLTGLIAERGDRSVKSYILAGAAGLAIVYIFGMVYFLGIKSLYLSEEVGIKFLLIYCAAVFIPGDFLSCVVGAYITAKLRPLLRLRETS